MAIIQRGGRRSNMKMKLDVFRGLRRKMNSTKEEGIDAHDLHMGNLSKEEKRARLERKEKKMIELDIGLLLFLHFLLFSSLGPIFFLQFH